MWDDYYIHPLPRYYRKKIWEQFPESLAEINEQTVKTYQDKETDRIHRQISKYGLELSVNIERQRLQHYADEVDRKLKKNRVL